MNVYLETEDINYLIKLVDEELYKARSALTEEDSDYKHLKGESVVRLERYTGIKTKLLMAKYCDIKYITDSANTPAD